MNIFDNCDTKIFRLEVVFHGSQSFFPSLIDTVDSFRTYFIMIHDHPYSFLTLS
jgi:hypothetical protein